MLLCGQPTHGHDWLRVQWCAHCEGWWVGELVGPFTAWVVVSVLLKKPCLRQALHAAGLLTFHVSHTLGQACAWAFNWDAGTLWAAMQAALVIRECVCARVGQGRMRHLAVKACGWRQRGDCTP